MVKACLCTICTCGRHKCPHNPRGIPRGDQPCVFSEYTNEYRAHDNYGKAKDCKPEHKPIRGDGVMDGLTTHRVDYIEHPLGKHYVHRADEYRQPDGVMDHETNYHVQFTKKPLETVRPIRREEQKRVAARFEGEPTYKVDYRKWDVQPITKAGNDYVYLSPEAPFSGNTNYQTEYVSHGNVQRQEMLRPNQATVQSDQPFDDSTHYRSHYIPHELQKREVKEKERWQPNPAVLDDLSNYRKDYIVREMNKTLSCKPDNKPYESDAKFSGSTTQRDDYRTMALEKPWVREREAYRKPDGSMDAMTTTHADYTKKAFDRAQAIRPAEAKKLTASFDGTTQYSTDYRSRPAGERAVMTQRERYNPNEAPFDGEPTYRRDYQPYEGATLTRSMKPVDPGFSSGAPLDEGTEYKKEYTFKFLPPCPSDAIMTGRNDTGYTFKEQDELGHKWYEVATRA